ncbi:MAG TPA: sigma 54-interacting transcriptional regulator [Bacillales bacterium]|nr:sigma 54-interacting transcriptional regulator [Bacillales bacterium]
MNAAMHEKLRPVFTLSVDSEPIEWKEKLTENKEPFLFLKRRGQLYAYVYLKDLEANNWASPELTLEKIESQAVPLENVGVLKPGKAISLPFIFRVLGEPIVLVRDEDNQCKGYARREDMLVGLFREETPNLNLLKVLLASIPMGIFVVDNDRKVVNCNESGLKMIRSTLEKVMDANAGSIFKRNHIEKVFSTGETLLNQIHITDEMGVLVDYSPIENADGKVDGILIIVQDLPMVEEMAMEIEFVKDLNRDLNAILSTIYDEILVVNAKGDLIRHSENYISDFWGVDLKDLVGENLLDLEKKGLFSPSVARLVIEQKKKVSIVQETKDDHKILAIGNPVFNEDGELQRIVIASRDITESTKLKSELRQTKEISRRYKQELDLLKNQTKPPEKIIYCSAKMEQMMRQIKKLAGFSSTVLIQGESGVGKELIAKAIHRQGNRADKPFLTINCGAIPENLLESELFGYVKGAFTGADAKGKSGYFQQASGGVLFLDEIGEISVQLQVKLLRVLQENEVVPVGSARPIPIDVQIIAATNRNLEKMVEQGTFREDLFYRINVIPVQVPPLRERTEDVPLLAFHFLQQLNQRYQKNYHFSPDALSLLEVYSWPGNIRELQNLIERMFVAVDDEVITVDFVGQFLDFGKSGKTKPVIPGIMPLHEAQEHVEEQLITLAMKKYKTTTKAARALGISQSAVSRKYQKILQKKENVLRQ